MQSILLSLAAAVSASGAAHGATADCPVIAGLSEIVESKGPQLRFIVVGEKHGTNEYPRMFGDILCYIASRRPVAVSLELSVRSTGAVREYVSSDGSASARAKLLSGPEWDPHYADGRSSAAMMGLIERIRLMKASGMQIKVYCSQSDAPPLPQFYNELYRATVWAEMAADNPGSLNVILVGTAHAALIDNDHYGFLPAAAHLAPSDVLSIGPTPEGGSGWNLDVRSDGSPSMGPHPLDSGPIRRAGLEAAVRSLTGYDAEYAVGAHPTPSPPANYK